MYKKNNSLFSRKILGASCALLIYSILSTIVSSPVSAQEICSSSASDTDGDGWGWENNNSCVVLDSESSGSTSNNVPQCIDPDGDGWGWDGSASCQVSNNNNNDPQCVDTDGDGWGWDGSASCLVSINNNNDSQCVDPDGDGWGWDGTASCQVSTSSSSSGNSTIIPNCSLVIDDSDGDGLGWENGQSCLFGSISIIDPITPIFCEDPNNDGIGSDRNGEICVVLDISQSAELKRQILAVQTGTIDFISPLQAATVEAPNNTLNIRGTSNITQTGADPTWLVVLADVSGSMDDSTCGNIFSSKTAMDCQRNSITGMLNAIIAAQDPTLDYRVAILEYGATTRPNPVFEPPSSALATAGLIGSGSSLGLRENFQNALAAAQNLINASAPALSRKQIYIFTDEEGETTNQSRNAAINSLSDNIHRDGIRTDVVRFGTRGFLGTTDCADNSVLKSMRSLGGDCNYYDDNRSTIPGGLPTATSSTLNHTVTLNIWASEDSFQTARTFVQNVTTSDPSYNFTVPALASGKYSYTVSNGRLIKSGRVTVQSKDYVNYVVLGDSYASGSGVRPTTPYCRRSAAAFGQLIESPISGRKLLPDFRACSSARLVNLYTEQTTSPDSPVPIDRQLNHVKADTDLVVLTMGGNDVGFVSLIAACLRLTTCHQRTFNNFLRNKSLTLSEIIDLESARNAERLYTALLDIKQKAPNATIILGGYPQLVAERCDGNSIFGFITSSERTLFREKSVQLDNVWRNVANRAGVHYASVLGLFEPGLDCNTTIANRTLNPMSSGAQPLASGGEVSLLSDLISGVETILRERKPGILHPTPLGHQIYADVINNVLANPGGLAVDPDNGVLVNPIANAIGPTFTTVSGQQVNWPSWLTNSIPRLPTIDVGVTDGAPEWSFSSYRVDTNSGNFVDVLAGIEDLKSNENGSDTVSQISVQYKTDRSDTITASLLREDFSLITSKSAGAFTGGGIARINLNVPSGLGGGNYNLVLEMGDERTTLRNIPIHNGFDSNSFLLHMQGASTLSSIKSGETVTVDVLSVIPSNTSVGVVVQLEDFQSGAVLATGVAGRSAPPQFNRYISSIDIPIPNSVIRGGVYQFRSLMFGGFHVDNLMIRLVTA